MTPAEQKIRGRDVFDSIFSTAGILSAPMQQWLGLDPLAGFALRLIEAPVDRSLAE